MVQYAGIRKLGSKTGVRVIKTNYQWILYNVQYSLLVCLDYIILTHPCKTVYKCSVHVDCFVSNMMYGYVRLHSCVQINSNSLSLFLRNVSAERSSVTSVYDTISKCSWALHERTILSPSRVCRIWTYNVFWCKLDENDLPGLQIHCFCSPRRQMIFRWHSTDITCNIWNLSCL